MIRIAVLIPTRNRKALLERALTSVFNQTSAPDEVIVVNDGSTDGTREYLEQLTGGHPHLKFFTREQGGSVNAARNLGVRNSTSSWIAFLDDDDELVPDFIEKARRELETVLPETGVVFFNTVIKRPQGKEFIGGYQFKEGESQHAPTYDEFLLKHNLRGDCKPIIRKEVFQDPSFSSSEDVNGFESYYFFSLIKGGVQFLYVNDISTIIHQEHDERLSNSAAKAQPKMFLKFNLMMIEEHKAAYRRHPKVLAKKYMDVAKIAFRLKDMRFIPYLLLSLKESLLARLWKREVWS